MQTYYFDTNYGHGPVADEIGSEFDDDEGAKSSIRTSVLMLGKAHKARNPLAKTITMTVRRAGGKPFHSVTLDLTVTDK